MAEVKVLVEEISDEEINFEDLSSKVNEGYKVVLNGFFKIYDSHHEHHFTTKELVLEVSKGSKGEEREITTLSRFRRDVAIRIYQIMGDNESFTEKDTLRPSEWLFPSGKIIPYGNPIYWELDKKLREAKL